MKVFNIDGGIGRVLCATPALNQLAVIGQEFVVITPWVEALANMPYKVYHSDSSNLFEDVISKGEYFCPEPYHYAPYYRQEVHLIDAFFGTLGVQRAELAPIINITEAELDWAEQTRAKMLSDTGKEKLIAFQPFGAMAKMSEWGLVDPSHRSLSGDTAKAIADKVQSDTSALMVNMSHIASNHPNIWQQQFTLRQLFALAYKCDAVFTVDSCLSHIGAAFGLPGVLVLGPTHEKNVGYPHYDTYQREGFPKSYQANRMPSPADKNAMAMQWTEKDISNMVESVKGFL